MANDFTNEDTWNGGFYELAIEIGPRSDDRLRASTKVLWAQRDLDGCYLRNAVHPSKQSRVAAELPDNIEGGEHLLGLATLPDGKVVPCGCVPIREDDGPDWLDFYLPLGALGIAYDEVGGYPFEESPSRSWREPIESWLAELAESMFRSVRFELALIGFEVSGTQYAQEIAISGVPEERWIGYVWPKGSAVKYYATNEWSTG